MHSFAGGASERRHGAPWSLALAQGTFRTRTALPIARCSLAFLVIVLALLTPSVCLASDLIPTPELRDEETGKTYEIPLAEPPAPPSIWYEWIDTVALLAGLSLASYFALVRRSRTGLFLLTIASLAWFGFWRQGCVCAIGATQNVALALFDWEYTIPVSVVVFFALPLVFTLFFGRTFCSSVCPLGAVQELIAIRSIQVPKWIDHSLGLIPYFYLGVAVAFAATGTAFLICRYDPFVGFFRLSGDVSMLIFGGCILVIGLFVGRPYCRYLCPYGAILGVLSRFSKWHLRIPPEECIQCRLCEDVCPYDAIQPPTVDPPPGGRPAARRRLALMLIAPPLLILVGIAVGWHLPEILGKLDFTVRLATQMAAEMGGDVTETTDATDAFRNTGQSPATLFKQAMAHWRGYRYLGAGLGAWFGLVIGVKLIHLSIRRRRSEYAPDRGGCISCGRCFWYCPPEKVRLGLIKDVSELVDISQLPVPASDKT
jgi:ferredoxin